MKRRTTLILFGLIPTIVLAEGGLEGLEVFDWIYNTYHTLLITGATGIFLALLYLFKQWRWSLALSLLSAGILFYFYVYSFCLLDLREFIEPFRNHVLLLILTMLVVIAAKKIMNDPPTLLPFFTLNTCSILLLPRLIGLFFASVPFGFLPFLLYGLFSFVYSRKMILSGVTDSKKLFLRAALIGSLSFFTVFIFEMANLDIPLDRQFKPMHWIKMSFTILPVGLLITCAMTTLTSFIAIKKYR